jgi:probable lipoprotein NlpC
VKKITLAICLFIFATTSAFTQYCQDSSINDFAIKWLGKPYRFGGKDQKGIDCSALVQKFYKLVYNADIPRTCFYQFKHMASVDQDGLKPGDAVFFDSKRSPSGWHVGIYLGNDQFLHAANFRDGVKISCLEDDMYKRLYKGARRL